MVETLVYHTSLEPVKLLERLKVGLNGETVNRNTCLLVVLLGEVVEVLNLLVRYLANSRL